MPAHDPHRCRAAGSRACPRQRSARPREWPTFRPHHHLWPVTCLARGPQPARPHVQSDYDAERHVLWRCW